MKISFADALVNLEKQKQELLAEIETWPMVSLSFRPSPSEWSVMEMIDHLLRTEIAILAAAREGFTKPHGIRLSDKMRTYFLRRIFMSDRKVNVPPRASQILPGSNLNLPYLIEQWHKSRSDLQQFVQDHDSERLAQGIFQHPVGGWMGMPEVIDFFSVHLVHHNYQLTRIKQALKNVEKTQHYGLHKS